MEQQFFEWESWNDLDTSMYQFINCTLRQDIGNWKVGESIPFIVINYAEGVMQFLNSDGNELRKFELELSIK